MKLSLRIVVVAAFLLPFAGLPASAGPPRGVLSGPDLPAGLSPEVLALIAQARQAANSKDWVRTSELLEQVMEKAPDLQRARYSHGATLILQGKIDAGLAEMEGILGPNPDFESLFGIVSLLQQAKGTNPDIAFKLPVYQERALARGEAQGEAALQESEHATMMAMLALDMQKMDAFHKATAALVKYHPRLMQTHYLNGIRAALDEQWVEAEDEIRQAGRMGLPSAVVESLLEQGIHSRALPRRLGMYAFIAVAVWAVGLGGLFLLGRVLSALTMRSLMTDDPNREISSTERILRGVYRAVIGLAGLYYYISLPVVALMALAIAIGMGYGLLLLPRIPVKAIILVLAFFGAMLMMIVSIIKSCFVRVKELEPDRTLAPEEAPRLWDLTRDVATRLGTRPIDQIWITPGTELAVFERGGWLAKARDRAQRVLILGMGVVEGFRLDGFRAVLAHEYGHFRHRDTAGGDVALRVGNTMQRFAEAMIQQNNTQWWNLGWQFLRLYHFLFQRITHGASRLQEIHADRIAIRTYGQEAFASGLRHVVRRSIEFAHGRSLAFYRAGEQAAGIAAPSLRTRHAVQQASTRRQAEIEFAGRWRANSTADDTHPSPAERVRLAERLHADAGIEPCDGWLLDLFADPTHLRAEQDGKLAKELEAQRAAFAAYHKQIIAQLNAYIAQNPKSADAVFERGNTRFRMGEFGLARQDYDEALRLGYAGRALCHFNRGVTYHRLGDHPAAVADLEKANQLDSERALAANVLSELGEVHAETGALDAALAAYDQVLSLNPSAADPDVLLKRADVHYQRGDMASAVADYTQVLALDPQCAEAHAGRGRAELGREKRAEAEADFDAALRLEPGWTEVREALAGLRGPAGQPAGEPSGSFTG